MSWGYAGGLCSVPRQPLSDLDRLLCDRCGTQVVGLVAHCDECDWDCCSSCAAQLRQYSQQTDSSRAKASARVTCCNPACPSVVSSSSPVAAADDDVVRGELMSQPGAAQLSLEAVLPKDLVNKLDKLQQLAQVSSS